MAPIKEALGEAVVSIFKDKPWYSSLDFSEHFPFCTENPLLSLGKHQEGGGQQDFRSDLGTQWKGDDNGDDDGDDGDDDNDDNGDGNDNDDDGDDDDQWEGKSLMTMMTKCDAVVAQIFPILTFLK